MSAKKALPGISFQCSHCHLKFPSLAGLTKHIEAECNRAKSSSKVPLKCSDCRRKFGSLVTLKAHLKRGCPKVKKSKGDEIDPEDLLSKLPGIRAKVVKSSEKSYSLRNGRKSSNDTKFFFICPRCPQIFSTQELLDSHTEKCVLNEYLGPKKPPKSVESYRFDRIINMYVCSKCDDKFDFKSAMDEHMKSHPNFTCDTCHKSFESLIQFGFHTAKHNANTIMTCPCCWLYATKSKGDLTFHIQNEHPVEIGSDEAVCVVCLKTFNDPKKLQHHQKNYHKVTVDVEPSMGGRLLSPPAKSHSQEPLLCDTCGKYFSSKYRLERHHRAMHQGLKPFECRFCGRAFTGKDTMKKHERIHTGERPYSCEYCGKCFRQPGPFSVHLRIHTGERPYQCKFCKKGFITNQMRKSHMKNCPGRLGPGLDYGDYLYVPTVDFA